jgi:peptide/nickel transport system permease protein
MAPVLLLAANFASAILVESGLSFLGLGAQPPIQLGKHYKGSLQLHSGKPYLAMVPVYGHYVMTLAL